MDALEAGTVAPYGVGTELSRILKARNVPQRKCDHGQYANRLNVRGVDWCRENFQTIRTWIKRSTPSRKLPMPMEELKQCVVDACDAYEAATGGAHRFVEAVICINLDRRPDRWKEFAERVPNDWPFPPIQRFSAIDGSKVPEPIWFKQGNGAWGCYRSHMRILEWALNAGVKSLLILEDDAVFSPEFAKNAVKYFKSLPPSWSWAYIGGQHIKEKKFPPERVNENVLRPYNVNRTHGYAVRGEEFIKRLYQHLNDTQGWRPRHHIDHHYGRMIERREEEVFVPNRWLIGQAEGKSNINRADNPEKWWVNFPVIEHNNPMVAVVGQFRGGTSCTAGILHTLGVSMGQNFKQPTEANEKGFFEANWLAQLCRQCVKEPKMVKQLTEEVRVRKLRNWAYERKRAVRTKIHGGKHPALCMLIPELEQAWVNVRYIRVIRPVEESIKSLRRMLWPITDEAMHRMIKTRDDDLAKVGPGRVFDVQYHELLEDPKSVIKSMCEFLEFEPSDEALSAAIKFPEKKLRHVSI